MKVIYLVGLAAFLPVSVMAQTTTYKYDALGRLVGSDTTAQGNPVSTAIEYDAAGNRKRYQVSGAPSANGDPGAGASTPATRRFVVVPLNGFTLIPIN